MRARRRASCTSATPTRPPTRRGRGRASRSRSGRCRVPTCRCILRPAERTRRRAGRRPTGGSLRVVTTNLRAGYLRKNGVPYSENAVADRALGSLQATERRGVADDHDAGRRSAVPSHPEAGRAGVQEGTERRQMGSDSLLGAIGRSHDDPWKSPKGENRSRSSQSCFFRRFPRSPRSISPARGLAAGSRTTATRVEPVDLLGMPLSADGRAKALSYDIAALSATERQCQMYPPFYAISGPFPLQISMEPEPVTQKLLAWKIAGWGDRDETMIWMDGRPHPSKYAPHSHGGFTTGTWEGDTLTAVTTHFKLGDIKRHRGFSSDRATLTYRFNRHGDTADRHRHPRRPRVSRGAVRADRDLPLTTNPQRLPADGVRADRGAAAPARGSRRSRRTICRASTPR